MTELENKKAALELLQNETNDKLNDYKQQISILQKQIDDYNKPALEPVVFDQITEAIEKVLGDFDFTDVDNYQDLEYELDYDGRVSLSNIGFDPYDLQEEVCNAVYKLFKEADAPEELDTTEPDNHPVQ